MKLHGKVAIVKVNIEKNIVIKRFERTEWLNDVEKVNYRGSLRSCFERELKCLQELKTFEHFPQLIDFDETNLTITMDFRGVHVNPKDNNADLLPQVDSIIDTLRYKQILIPDTLTFSRVKIGKLFTSLLVKGRILSLIDFETCIPIKSIKIEKIPQDLIKDCQNCDYEALRASIKGFILGKYTY